MTATIEALKKVTVNIRTTSDSGTPDIPFTFIYGVASDGLCPFEKELHGKNVTDTMIVEIPSLTAQEYFGHLLLPLRQELGLQLLPETISWQFEVTDISVAENREVVESLAKAMASGGCGGSCGCGCG